MNVFIYTLGCKINEVDSELYAQELRKLGADVVNTMETADAVIVNSCCVTNRAQAQSLQFARRVLRLRPGVPVYLTGCGSALLALSHHSAPAGVTMISMRDRATVARRIAGEEVSGTTDVPWIDERICGASRRNRVDVRVQEGCNNMCTYCIVPFVRGTQLVSKPRVAVVHEILDLGRAGVKEVVLTGTEIGKYDDAGAKLADLVEDLISGLQGAGLPTRIRLSSLNPDGVTPALENLFRNYPGALCPQLHVPLQSGSDRILQYMRRPYRVQDLFDLAGRLRAATPLFTLTTDIITGFPGEDECDFQETLDAVEHVRFAKVHAFPYSRRPFTPAADRKWQVPVNVARERVHRVLNLAESSGLAFSKEFIGRSVTIVSEKSSPGAVEGYSEYYLWTRARVPDGQVVEHDRFVEAVVENSAVEGDRVVLSGRVSI